MRDPIAYDALTTALHDPVTYDAPTAALHGPIAYDAPTAALRDPIIPFRGFSFALLVSFFRSVHAPKAADVGADVDVVEVGGREHVEQRRLEAVKGGILVADPASKADLWMCRRHRKRPPPETAETFG